MAALDREGNSVFSGSAAVGSSEPGATPTASALGHYLSLACRIACCNDVAIRDAMNDSHALPYGLGIWAVSIALPLVLVLGLAARSGEASAAQIIELPLAALWWSAIYGIAHMGICHLFAKYFCAGEGTFIQLIRPLLFAEVVYLLLVIPFAGSFLALIAWLCAMTAVFQEVHGMEPLTAFLLSASVGLTLRLGLHFVLHTRF